MAHPNKIYDAVKQVTKSWSPGTKNVIGFNKPLNNKINYNYGVYG